MSTKSCGSCKNFTHLHKYSICSFYDTRTTSDTSKCNKYTPYNPKKYIKAARKFTPFTTLVRTSPTPFIT